METLNAAAPENAVVLFNGKDVDNWTTRDGQPAGWKVEDGVLHVVGGTGDIMTKERMTDFFMHLEFRCPDMPEATGQAKGNSGVFLQGRYEVQVLDSHGWKFRGWGTAGQSTTSSRRWSTPAGRRWSGRLTMSASGGRAKENPDLG